MGYPHEKQAAKIVLQVLKSHPNSPGALHFTLHSYDQPGLAIYALEAANRYEVVAPNVPHALHMPSHIYVDLGMWEQAIVANQASMNSAYDYKMGGRDHDWMHASSFIEFALLQKGLDAHATALYQSFGALAATDHPPDPQLAGFYLIETKQWNLAQNFSLSTWAPGVPWPEYVDGGNYLFSLFTNLIGNVHNGDSNSVLVVSQQLLAANASLSWPAWGKENLPYWRDNLMSMVLSGQAWAAWTQDAEVGINMMQSVVNLEARSFETEIGHILSADAQLAQMKLFQEDYQGALELYQEAEIRRPNRFWTLYGIGWCAENMNNHALAVEYYTKLVTLTDRNYNPPPIKGVPVPANDGPLRPEVLHAREYIKMNA